MIIEQSLYLFKLMYGNIGGWIYRINPGGAGTGTLSKSTGKFDDKALLQTIDTQIYQNSMSQEIVLPAGNYLLSGWAKSNVPASSHVQLGICNAFYLQGFSGTMYKIDLKSDNTWSFYEISLKLSADTWYVGTTSGWIQQNSTVYLDQLQLLPIEGISNGGME